jgi:hypothetical protein
MSDATMSVTVTHTNDDVDRTTTTFTDQNIDNPVNDPGGPGFPTASGRPFRTTRRVPIPDPPEGGVGASSSRPFDDSDEEVFSSGIRSPEEILGTANDGDGFTINEDDFSL